MELWLALVGMALAAGVGVLACRLLPRPAARPRLSKDGAQEVQIVVQHGYVPDRVQTRTGIPLRITFDRREDGECTEWVVFPGLEIACRLPAFRRTPVEFTPVAPGEFEFRCKLGVCRGRLVVTA